MIKRDFLPEKEQCMLSTSIIRNVTDGCKLNAIF